MGYDTGVPDGAVLTNNINTVLTLYLGNASISDLTGIEDFSALEDLYCDNNQLLNIDVSQNSSLAELDCSHNQLSSLDVAQNSNLEYFLGR